MLAGTLEMLLRASIVLIPLVLVENRILALMVLLGAGLFFGFLNGPFYNGWLADIIPENIRARFIARITVDGDLSTQDLPHAHELHA